LNSEHGITIVVVTHERDIAAYARRIMSFRDGKIESDVTNASAEAAAT
jgi:putative ABC transport system ATP-binding protein